MTDSQLRAMLAEAVTHEGSHPERIARTTAYGAQAIALLQLFGDSLDDALLRDRVRAEDAEDALDALKRVARESTPISEDRLQTLLRGL